MGIFVDGKAKVVAGGLVVLGVVVGALVYDAAASARMLRHADCRELAPILSTYLGEADKFLSADPDNWYDVKKLYRQLDEKLDRFGSQTDRMAAEVTSLRAALDSVTSGIYRFNPSEHNRQRLAEASQQLEQQLVTMVEMCSE